MAAPTFTYWHVYTDENGVSRQKKAEITGFEQESMGGDADPQWNNKLYRGNIQVLFTELPANWVGEWHENPRPQWIVPLSGGWYVKTMDGTRVDMQVGDYSFGADQNTVRDDEGRMGHQSGTIGNGPCRMMIVQLLDPTYVGAKPGAFSGGIGG
ncbi:MAG: cupin domain-containing protein [Saprospiraceae bacterium]